MKQTPSMLGEMNDRSREVFRRVVEGYLADGLPVGSRTLTRDFSEKLSAATIRNVMQDLEFLGLLDSPHISAGRIPTQLGLRMFVDGLLEVPVRFLSTGQRKRASLARLLNSGRQVWLLDEPLNGLDDQARGTVEALLALHCGGGGIALVASHQPIALPGQNSVHLPDFTA